jgi:hypothetical protein
MKTRRRKENEKCARVLFNLLKNLGTKVLEIRFQRDNNKNDFYNTVLSMMEWKTSCYGGKFVVVLELHKDVTSFCESRLLDVISIPCIVMSKINPLISETSSLTLLWNEEKNEKYLKSLKKII